MTDDRPRRERRLWAPDVRRDVDDELAYHLEMREREYVARGLSRGEPLDAARRKFGNPAAVAAACRDIDERRYREEGRATMWNDLRQDVAYGFRLLGRSPGFTAVAVLTLALGIGATTAIFSVIDAALLRPLPYPDPEQLVEVTVGVRVGETGRVHRLAPSMDDVEAWRRDGQVFSHVAAGDRLIQPVVLDGAEPERVGGMQISEDYLGLHGVKPLLGRGFSPDDLRPGADPVILLGHRLWQRRFGGDPGVLGRVVRIDDAPARIVGILPAWFYRDTALWQPLQITAPRTRVRGSGISVYARLWPGVSVAQAQQRLPGLLATTGALQGALQGPAVGVQLTSLHESETRTYRTTTRVLAAAVTFILLIACTNVAGLLLARGATRGTELGIRASLGAGRSRLVRQLLAEGVVLSLLGGAMGVLLAWISLDALVANIPLSLPENSPPTLDLRVLGFTLVVSIVTGVLFGLAPALKMSRVSHTNVLSPGSSRVGSALSRRSGQALIVVEVALAVVLVAGGALMLRSFVTLLAVDVGVDPDAVITMEVTPVDPDPDVARRYYPAVVEALRGRPGVDAVGAADHIPLGGSSMSFTVRVGDRGLGLSVRYFVRGYFEAIGFAPIAGRFPSDADVTYGLPAAVINSSAAARMFEGASPLGGTFEMRKHTYQVVAVVRDVRHGGPLAGTTPEVFLPYGLPAARPTSQLTDRPRSTGSDPREASVTTTGPFPLMIVVRSTLPTSAVEPILREAANAPGPRVIIERIRRGSDWLGDRVATPRRRTVLLGLLGGLGLVLTLVGIFGTTAYAVGRRTQEIGVRMALGARPQEVVTAVLRDTLWPTLAGIVIGLGAATLATRVIASFLFNTEPTDPGTFAAAAALMALAAARAAWIPARRAARVDPVEALRTT